MADGSRLFLCADDVLDFPPIDWGTGWDVASAVTGAGYHIEFGVFDLHGREVEVVDCAVGAFFAGLVAEQMFACRCEVLSVEAEPWIARKPKA